VLSLPELQFAFSRSVTGPPSADLLSLIADDGFASAERLSIYRNNVVSRLSETLRAAFPVVCRIVGTDCFDYATHRFMDEHLPSEACLSAYGAQFPDFLKSLLPLLDLSYLPDVARLEWSIAQVVRAVPQDWLPITRLGDLGCDPADLRLRITACVEYLASDFRIDQIWIAHQHADQGSSSWHIEEGPTYLAAHAGETLRLVAIPKAAWIFRSHLAQGLTLGSATALALDVDPHFDISSALGSLFGEHLVTAIGDRLE
jgi:hypothetical protein